MRFLVWFACFLLLPLNACDTGEDEHDSCSFEMQFSGAVQGEASGSAIFALPERDSIGVLLPPYRLRIQLHPHSGGRAAGFEIMDIFSEFTTLPPPGSYTLAGGDEGFFGRLYMSYSRSWASFSVYEGALVLDDTSPVRLRGSFDAIAIEDTYGEDTLFVTARFNAQSGVEWFECADFD